MKTDTWTILQIISAAPGWRVEYRDADGTKTQELVAAWALVAEPIPVKERAQHDGRTERRFVTPLVAGDLGSLAFAATGSNTVSVHAPFDEIIEAEKARPRPNPLAPWPTRTPEEFERGRKAMEAARPAFVTGSSDTPAGTDDP